ncbi:hypothetical protein [Flavobacterium sp. AJR]|uniref:hypothetical protein n=1 Tax=Flavobacterium sp. AJR TaxID=1979369 RepID=UPI000A3D641C|nr:hypothetical protein [Flavobacterium sp. AJR]OUL60387.1 hypothetical protein B8T70_20670 [Flavobacterium sp. AJR]
MTEKLISNFKSSNQNILKIYSFVKNNIESKTWESKENLELHRILIELSENDWNSLIDDFSNWSELEQNIVSDCVAYGIDGKFEVKYDNEKRLLAQELYSKMQNGFCHPEIKKWKKNFKVHSKTKSQNCRVLGVYDYLLKNEYVDSDYWSWGGGSHEIQNKLNSFSEKDWEDLKEDIINWNEDDRDILIKSVAFGFDKMLTPYIKNEIVSRAGKFLLDLFMLNIGDRNEIAYCSFFIAQSDLNNLRDLETLKDWLIANGYDSEIWMKSEINALKSIEEAITKASR